MIIRLLGLLACCLVFGSPAGAQDVILDVQGNEQPGQVVEVTPTQVIFRPQGSDPAAAAVALDKQLLFMIRFANGTKETFAQNLLPPPAPATSAAAGDSVARLTSEALYAQGQADALKLHNYKGAFWGTYAATLVTMPLATAGGIITGGAIGLTRPVAANNPQIPPAMLRQPSYVAGYEEQAQRHKLQKAAAGYGAAWGTTIGVGLLYVIGLILSTASGGR